MTIKLIRSIRLCKTPALGGKRYICTACQKSKYVFFGCGNSRCPKCQGIKRMQWQDKISKMLFKCPYVHMVFTLPSQLRSLARMNPNEIYNCLLRSAWKSLKRCCEDPDNLGATPGAVMVLHTFGSDLKYHVHVHALVSFGGIDSEGQWRWPTRKKKLVGFRSIRTEFKKEFMGRLEKLYPKLITSDKFEELSKDVQKKQWCVHTEPPVSNTKHIEEYLGKYINRIGLSKKRFKYEEVRKRVFLRFKDYGKKDKGVDSIPIATKEMLPLAAIHQIVQHSLPKYFQKCRYTGLHSSASAKKHKETIPVSIRNNCNTIRSFFQIIMGMLGIEALKCAGCGNLEMEVKDITPDHKWIGANLPFLNKVRGSPKYADISKHTQTSAKMPNGQAMFSFKPLA